MVIEISSQSSGEVWVLGVWRMPMDKSRPPTGGYILAAAFGAVAGGVAVAVVTKAIPEMMSRMMDSMMMRMSGENCDPEEM